MHVVLARMILSYLALDLCHVYLFCFLYIWFWLSAYISYVPSDVIILSWSPVVVAKLFMRNQNRSACLQGKILAPR